MFDLRKLGQLVVKAGIPHDKPFFQLEKIEIEELGHCFMEAVNHDDPQAKEAKEDGKLPF
jgi:hypothetical protein